MFYEQKNSCVFVGNLGQDPEERETSGGKQFARFSLAVNERRKVDDEWEQATTWVPCVLFGNSAGAFLDIVSKGNRVMVTCKYQTYTYEDNDTGETRYGHNFQVVAWDKLTPKSSNGNGQPEADSYDDDGEYEEADALPF